MVESVETIYHPTYLIHPETKKILEKHGHKVEFDPVLATSEYRSYKSEFLDKRPNGEETPITAKVTTITRMRSADHRLQFLVWSERQTFIDNLKNEISRVRNYCGIYKMPKFKGTTVPDGQGSIKTDFEITGWNTLYEFPFNEANANALKAQAENPYTLQTYIQTDGNEEVWTLKPEDWDKWLKWDFEALLEYCRTPLKFRAGGDNQLNPISKPYDDQFVVDAPAQSQESKSKGKK